MTAPLPVLIVALGDSTTAGTPGFRSPLEAPPDGEGDIESQFAYWLMRAHPEWRVLNRGVNGERTDQIRARFARDVAAASPDAAIVLAGVNDVYQGKSSADVVRELQAIYALARAARIPIVAGTILPYDSATGEQNSRMRDINEWIRDYTSRHADVIYCDTRAAVAAPADADRLLSSPDGLHPSPAGYKSMAASLEPAVRLALARAQRLL